MYLSYLAKQDCVVSCQQMTCMHHVGYSPLAAGLRGISAKCHGSRRRDLMTFEPIASGVGHGYICLDVCNIVCVTQGAAQAK